MPQQSVAQVRLGQTVAVKIDAYKDQTFPGEISAINPKVDASSRNVQVRATLKNADHKLLPGMYATVDISTGAPQNYITLPQTAITYNPYGDTVYIVDSKGTDADGKPQLIARQTFVTTGPTRGDQVAVLKGVNEGDMIVTAGQIKLHNGSTVLIDNSVTPTADAAPTSRSIDRRATMHFTDIFIRRPVLASVVSLLILVLGLRAYSVLPILQYPRTENAIVTVTTIYYGADPDVVAGFITTPLENAIAQANGIDYMSSASQSGRQHDHRLPAAQLRCRQGADRDQHQGQFGPQSTADRHAAADADGQDRPDHRRHVYRLQQRHAWRRTRSPITSCAWCSRSCRR